MLTDRARDLLDWLDKLPPDAAAPPGSRPPPSRWLAEAEQPELAEFFHALAERPVPAANGPAANFVATLLRLAAEAWKPPAPGGSPPKQSPAVAPELRAALAALYRHLGPAGAGREHLLAILTAARSEADLRLFADLMAGDPPAGPLAGPVVLWPLFSNRDYEPAWLFPRILDTLEHPAAAAAVLDLANYLFRSGRVDVHPAVARKDQLFTLLGALAGRLGRLEERPVTAEDSAESLRDMVQESVALAAPLCDAVGLIGDPDAIPKLRQILALGHRRLRAEAAAALARLGEEEGRQELLALAAEPVARLRVLTYAEELGIADQIAEEFRSPVARAEAELVALLASPTQLGLPPHELDLVDSRTLYWPGYDSPVTAFLFRFRYRFPEGIYDGIGIAGPLTYALRADLSSFSLDDQYAAFAGYSAEHEEIQELDVARLNQSGQTEVARLVRRAKDAGYERIEPRLLGIFFGEKELVAEASFDGQPGVLIVDVEEEHWFSQTGPRSLGPQEAYWLVKGRKLLKAFNK